MTRYFQLTFSILFLALGDLLQALWRNYPDRAREAVLYFDSLTSQHSLQIMFLVVIAGILFLSNHIRLAMRSSHGLAKSFIFFAWTGSIILPAMFIDPFGWEETFEFRDVVFFGILRTLAGLSLAISMAEIGASWLESLADGMEYAIRILSFRSFLALGLFFFIVQSSFLCYGVLGGVPHIQDEIVLDWQSRIYASGHLFFPGLKTPEFLRTEFSGICNGHIVTYYPFGWPLILALGHLLGIASCLSIVLGVIYITILACIARETLGETESRLTIFLAVFSPFLLLHSAARMSHLLTGGCSLLMIYVLMKVPRFPFRLGFLLGLIAAFPVLVRPLDGLCILVTLTFLVFHPSLRPRITFAGLFGLTMGLVGMAGIFFLYNHAMTGSPFMNSYSYLLDDQLKLAFGESNYLFRFKHDWKHAATHIWENLTGSGMYLTGGFLASPSIILLGFLNMVRRGQTHSNEIPVYQTFGVLSILTMAGYSLLFFHDYSYGPRYYFCLIPFGLYVLSRVLTLMINDSGPEFRRKVLRVMGFHVVFSCLYTFPFLSIGVLNPNYWNAPRVPLAQNQAAPKPPAIVLLENELWPVDRCMAKMAGMGVSQPLIARMHMLLNVNWSDLDKKLDAFAAESPLPPGKADKLALSLMTPLLNEEVSTYSLHIVWAEVFRSTNVASGPDLFWCFHDLGEAWNSRLLRAHPGIPAWKARCHDDMSTIDFFPIVPNSAVRK